MLAALQTAPVSLCPLQSFHWPAGGDTAGSTRSQIIQMFGVWHFFEWIFHLYLRVEVYF